MAVTMATAVAIGRTGASKVVPNNTLTHTPPPTGALPTFFGEGKNPNKVK